MTKTLPTDPGNKLNPTLTQVNAALKEFSDKDWNYSRISLQESSLDKLDSCYVLGLETLDLTTKQGRSDLKNLSDEVKWGDRHSSELGMLEIVSLRLNKALLEITSDDYWQNKRPVVRIIKMDVVAAKQDGSALWYRISEVAGDDFDNR